MERSNIQDCYSFTIGLSEIFVVFFLNSRKYGLGSLRKNPTKVTSQAGSGPKCEQLALYLQPNPTQPLSLSKLINFSMYSKN